MSDVKTLMRKSEGQLALEAEYNKTTGELKQAKKDAKKAKKDADAQYKETLKQNEAKVDAAQKALKQAKNGVPQDVEQVKQATANLEQAKAAAAESNRAAEQTRNAAYNEAEALVADKKAARDAYDKKEDAFDQEEKARILGGNETKTDTLNKATNADDPLGDKHDTNGAYTEDQDQDQDKNQNQNNQTNKSDNKDNAMSDKRKLPFSQSFYDTLSRKGRNQIQGNHFDVSSATAKEQAQNYRNRSAQNQMEAQRAQQIANQNPYAEAGKIASVQNDAENRQTINNTSFAAGTGAARLRKTNTPDVQSQMAREDQQAQVANQRREEANTAQEENTAAEGDAQHFKVSSRDYDESNDESARLSMGEPADTKDADTRPKDETNQETQEQKTPEEFNANWQNVMNYMTYGNDPTSDWSKGGGKDGGAAKQYVEAMGWQPLSADDVKNASKGFDSPTGELQQIMSSARPDFMKAWSDGSGRVQNGNQINQGDKGFDQAVQSNTQMVEKPTNTNSDARIKDIKQCLCDARMKWIKEDWDRDGMPSREDLEWLLSQRNDLDDKDFEDDSVLSAYADNIRNYVYNYKPEATQVDPSIDPNQEHIGPMAQDIEQVNPACIKETAEGVKTVDTSRLAMMNAGAIGDLARALQSIDERLKKLGV